MGLTPIYNIPFPDDDDDPDGPDDLSAAALRIDTALDEIVPNSGVQTNMNITPAINWTPSIKSHVVDGRLLFLRVQFTYSGAQIDASAAGNITDVTIGTIEDVPLRPAIDWYGMFRASLTSGACQISAAAGVIRLTDMHSTSRIEPAHTVDISAAYPLP